MFAFVRGEALEDFITYFQAFQVDDADVFRPVFPNLPLLKFQRHVEGSVFNRSGKTVSPEVNRGETVGLLFLAGRLFAGCGRFFLGGGAAGFGIFLTGLLLVRFGGFISHNF